MNRYFIGLLLFVLLVAIVHAQDVQIAGFACKEGWCLVSEKEVEQIIKVFNWLQQEVLRLKASTGCT